MHQKYLALGWNGDGQLNTFLVAQETQGEALKSSSVFDHGIDANVVIPR